MNRYWQVYIKPVALAGLVWFLAVHDTAWLACLLVIAASWPLVRRRPTLTELLAEAPTVVVGLSCTLMIELLPRALSQTAVAIIYLVWLLAWAQIELRRRWSWAITAIAQILAFEALFLWSAIGHPLEIILLITLFAASFVLIYERLTSLNERAAAVMAATWAVITVELAMIFLTWLVSYVIAGGYFVVPQATIILSGLGYCAGSIYLAGKRGELSRARLSEYLIIALILILVVVAGTGWRGTI